ncbi:MAG: polysaccharide biosynthesis/export family protein, partial [Thermodesulfobacteriota bacterium]
MERSNIIKKIKIEGLLSSGRGALLLFCIATILLSTGCFTRRGKIFPIGSEVVLEKTSFSVGDIEYPYNLFPEYKVVPGDILDVLFQIRTWTEREDFQLQVDHTIAIMFEQAKELDMEQLVRPDGTISLPYVGEVYVVGKTV